MLNRRQKYLFWALIAVAPWPLFAGSVGASGGLTLLEAPTAKASALGEAYSAGFDDIAAFNYNPASLASLRNNAFSLSYQNGLIDDSYGQFSIGLPQSPTSALGLLVSYYDGGDLDLFDGSTTRTVTAQRDIAVGLGMARTFGAYSYGVTAKIINSELIESQSARAYAVDLGMSVPMTSRLRIAGAFQNFGTELKYIEDGDPLPRIARGGASYLLIAGAYPTSVFTDLPYYFNEHSLNPALGVETVFGVLGVRAGYAKTTDDDKFSVGMGIGFGQTTFDYSFDLKNDLDSRHRVSLAMKFGSNNFRHDVFALQPRPAGPSLTALQPKRPETKPVWSLQGPAEEGPVLDVKALEKQQKAAEKAAAKAEALKQKEIAAQEKAAPKIQEARLKEMRAEEAARAKAEALRLKQEQAALDAALKLQAAKESEKKAGVVLPPVEKPVVTTEATERPAGQSSQRKRQIYVVKMGDTLEKIANDFYGDREEWKTIFKANEHLMEHRRDLEAGKRIIIP